MVGAGVCTSSGMLATSVSSVARGVREPVVSPYAPATRNTWVSTP